MFTAGIEIVASGEVNVMVGKDFGVSNEGIRSRAFRTCHLGSASCGFSGVELNEVSPGVMGVDVLCSKGSECGNNSDALSAGLGRLSTQAANSHALAKANKTEFIPL